MTLHCYDSPKDAPSGVTLADAAAVIATSRVFRHKATGSYAIFADYFRYELLRRGFGLWIDCDVYCVKPIGLGDGHVYGWQAPDSINNAVLGLPANSPALTPLIATFTTQSPIMPWYPLQAQQNLAAAKRAGAVFGAADLPWGATGPLALTHVLTTAGLARHARPHRVFYPIPFEEADRLLSPEYDAAAAIAPDTLAVHLWNEKIRRGLASLSRGSPIHRLISRGELYDEAKIGGAMTSDSQARGILIAATGWNQEEWAAPIRAAAPERRIVLWPEVGDAAAVGYALVWRPPADLFRRLPNLRAIFSLGAGVDHLVFRDDLPDVPIVRVVDPDLTQRMTEWVTLQVLMHHRRQRTYDAQQRRREWRELAQPAAGDVRVGIMGMGVLGRDAAAMLARLGFDVAGWSRRPVAIDGVASFHGPEQLGAFLARTDILVVLLPLTAETRGILDMGLFRQLARDGVLGGPVLINAGRGGLQVEGDIVAALDAGELAGASLDVFETEPLPAGSPLWGRENVIVTPHCAAASAAAALVPGIVRQIEAFERGERLVNVIDRAAGY